MTVYAQQFLDSRGGIVDSAIKLADQVVIYLAAQEPIIIELVGMRGLSSSYFNVLIRRLIEVGGAEAVDKQIFFRFDSDAQREVYQRSLEAVKRENLLNR